MLARAAARVEAGVLRARGGREQARGQARVAGRRLGRGAQVGRRRGAVAAPLGRLLGPQAALHEQRRAGRHRHAALLRLRLRLCARSALLNARDALGSRSVPRIDRLPNLFVCRFVADDELNSELIFVTVMNALDDALSYFH